MSEENEKHFLTIEEAKEMLPDGDNIHTFKNPGDSMLIGADWSREEIIKALEGAEAIEIAGETATNMGHGLAIWETKKSVLFVETKKTD